MDAEPKFDATRSAAIREMLIDNALKSSRPESARRTNGLRFAILLSGAAVIVVVGLSTLAVSTGWLSPTRDAEGSAGISTTGPSPWPRNSHGQTYGVQGNHPIAPDLIREQATNGQFGYVFSDQLKAATDSPTSVQLPVYKSDGTTKIGVIKSGG